MWFSAIRNIFILLDASNYINHFLIICNIANVIYYRLTCPLTMLNYFGCLVLQRARENHMPFTLSKFKIVLLYYQSNIVTHYRVACISKRCSNIIDPHFLPSFFLFFSFPLSFPSPFWIFSFSFFSSHLQYSILFFYYPIHIPFFALLICNSSIL